MLRPILVAIPVGLVIALPNGAAASKAHSTRAAGPALPVVVQDDARLIWHEESEVRATMSDLKHLGVDWVRLTASWSELTRDPQSTVRPAFDATNPGAYEQDKWK